jgi:hypothetical protein
MSLIPFVHRVLTAVLLLCSLGACGLLDTEQPNIIDPDNIDSPEGAQSLRLGAIADFTFVKDGDVTKYPFLAGLILLGGLLADEFVHSTTGPPPQEIDQRTTATFNPLLFDIYRNLHQARAAAERAAAALRRYLIEPDNTVDIAEMHALAGFTYIYFGETFCSGVPFSRVSGDSLVFGSPETTTQIFERALSRFDSAAAEPGLALDDGPITNLIVVGQGRALVNLGRFSEAAAAVQAVPTDFVYATEHAESPLRLQNAIWSYTNGYLWSVSDSEGGSGLPYRSAEDPRVPWTDFGETGSDLITPQYGLDKYPDASSPVPVADGIEARLIEAEAALQAGDPNGMTTILNDLRLLFPDYGLAGDLATPGSQSEAEDLLFTERAFWLFATGHRLGDMRRLIRQYGRIEDTVFPTGDYHKGGSYGSDVNLPIPIAEQNNPKFSACLDREA